jgi:hypothetical protein
LPEFIDQRALFHHHFALFTLLKLKGAKALKLLRSTEICKLVNQHGTILYIFAILLLEKITNIIECKRLEKRKENGKKNKSTGFNSSKKFTLLLSKVEGR